MPAPFSLTPGLTWNAGSVPCTFIRMSSAGGILTALIRRGEEYEEIPLADLACEIVTETWAARPDLREHADDDWMLATLPGDAHAEFRRKLLAVLEVTTGIGRGGERRKEYDLDSTTKTQRLDRKANELGVSSRTLRRWVEAYDKDGDAGLVHGNRTVGSPLDLYPDDVVQIARGLVEEEITRSTKHLVSLVVMLN